ncbi:hypothetical protein ESCO_001311 [Escovopsis weberi]|uniref:DUF7514 domain-containing protein n=1 Tax=Escovopsis weberi TaxID=150374 RepID=A0A0M8MU60_ESCWE|nr:hypothetical protein ESCO_001311 [Escovopsis weberi]
MQTLASELASALGVAPPTGKTAAKRHLDDVIRGLEEWNAKWLQELVTKVKSELAQSAEHDARSIQSLSSREASIPRSSSPSSSSSSSSSSASKPYQPTVEDIRTPEDDFELGRCFPKPASPQTINVPPAAPSSPHLSHPPSPPSSSSSSLSSASPSPPPSPASSYSYENTPLHSRPSSPSAAAPAKAANSRCCEPDAPPARPGVRFSDRPPHLAPVITRQRPPSHPRDGTGGPRLSAVDAKWGTLFDERDEPTPELGRFLRGIANYIIAEYAPVDSLVITPEKLQRFYTEYKLDQESIPFQRIFDSTHPITIRALELLYLDLRCEHHLVPPPRSCTPRIPALTPAGFQAWATMLIRAAPGREARRLALMAQDLPLVADDRSPSHHSPLDHTLPSCKPERLPRQLSRHLFPERPSSRALDALAAACAAWRDAILLAPAEQRPAPDARHAAPRTHSHSCEVEDRPERAGGRRSSGSGTGGAQGRCARGRRMEASGYVYARSREPSPPGLAERSRRRR